MNPISPVRFERISYGGWANCVRLSNRILELVATTDIGPRIIRFGPVTGPNLFKEWADQLGQTGGDDWRIYGGHRLWHSPEAKPRCYAPDNEPVEMHWDGQVLRLIQKTEILTGIQKILEISIGPNENQAVVVHRLVNQSVWPIEAAAWALTVMQGEGRAIFPQEPASDGLLPVRPLVLWGYTNMADPRWTWGRKYIELRSVPAMKTPQKIGLMNTAGWAAFCRGDWLMFKRHRFDAGAVYPDFGCNSETYTNGDMLEVESLGPMVKMAPGGTSSHIEHWHLFQAKVGTEEQAIDQILPALLARTGSGPSS